MAKDPGDHLPGSRAAKVANDHLRFLERSTGRLRAKAIRLRLRMFSQISGMAEDFVRFVFPHQGRTFL
jgi:hypothetical protein